MVELCRVELSRACDSTDLGQLRYALACREQMKERTASSKPCGARERGALSRPRGQANLPACASASGPNPPPHPIPPQAAPARRPPRRRQPRAPPRTRGSAPSPGDRSAC